jgi:RNA polymerase sigma-70 factor (ECF subfamily)
MADRDTIFRLLMQHEGEIRAFVGSMLRDRGLCDDVFQEVAVTLWEQADRYDESRPFGPWARGIAANKVLERRRGDQRFPLAFSPETIEAVAQGFARTESDARRELDALAECFKRLSENARRLLSLRYEGDLSVGEKRLSSSYEGKVTLACVETDSPGWVEVPSRTPLRKIAISSLAAKADKVISLPVAKTHCWAQLTLALKNFLGITPLSRYAQLIDKTWWNRGTLDHSSPEAIAQVYLDIVNALRPALSIIDFSIGIEGDGPTRSQGGTTVDMKERLGSWAVIASRDIMAADATVARIMSHDPKAVKQLTMGFDMGLGEIRTEQIEVVGEKLDNLRVPWKPATMKGHKAKE